jgi:hypothetical protein
MADKKPAHVIRFPVERTRPTSNPPLGFLGITYDFDFRFCENGHGVMGESVCPTCGMPTSKNPEFIKEGMKPTAEFTLTIEHDRKHSDSDDGI